MPDIWKIINEIHVDEDVDLSDWSPEAITYGDVPPTLVWSEMPKKEENNA